MKKIAILTFVVAMIAVLVLAQTDGDKYLIKNATIIPVEGEPLENADLLIEGGKISAMANEIPAPDGTKIIDASSMFVYPGFIDGHTHLGLSEVSAISSTVDIREMGKENPELKVAWAINPHSIHFKTSRINGTTTALVAPSGGTYPGMSALVKMDGWTIDEMLIKEVATSFINFPMSPRPTRGARVGPQTESRVDITAKLVEKIQEYLNEVRHYLKLRKQGAEDPTIIAPDLNPKYEALAPVLDGTLPVIISVEKAKDIELAIKFVQEEKINAIFRGCIQGGEVADKIKEAGIPVIIDDLYTGPLEPEDGYDAPFRNVSELAKAGVEICFSTGRDPALGKDLTYHAARAVAFGLDRDEAIKALTINPAKIFGIENRVGSLKVGKDADLFITTGDPLDLRSEVKHLFINGRDMDLGNWWQTLYDTWRKRPIK
ncbi:MAG: amidohydrolase family protein [Candidatus Aminicenantes bacterium]|nr:MAG: amidohydrolase family protein [Candidatus Aminicenantes bacterium]